MYENPLESMPPTAGHAVLSSNEGDNAPLDAFGVFEAALDRWSPLLRFVDEEGDSTNYFREIGDTSEFQYRAVHANLCGSPAGEYTDLLLEKFLPGMAYDAKAKKQIHIRRRVITHSASGEPIFPAMTIAACEFVDRFEPAGDWLSKSEWSNIKAELKPIIDREKSVKAGERGAASERHARAGRAQEARDNPSEFMERGISEGIAQALKALGLTGKAKP